MSWDELLQTCWSSATYRQEFVLHSHYNKASADLSSQVWCDLTFLCPTIGAAVLCTFWSLSGCQRDPTNCYSSRVSIGPKSTIAVSFRYWHRCSSDCKAKKGDQTTLHGESTRAQLAPSVVRQFYDWKVVGSNPGLDLFIPYSLPHAGETGLLVFV